jgi:hypothetical protein
MMCKRNRGENATFSPSSARFVTDLALLAISQGDSASTVLHIEPKRPTTCRQNLTTGQAIRGTDCLAACGGVAPHRLDELKSLGTNQIVMQRVGADAPHPLADLG